MSSDDGGALAATPEQVVERVALASVDDLEVWEGPLEVDVGAAAEFARVFGAFRIAVVQNGRVVYGQDAVLAERHSRQNNGMVPIIDITDLGWSDVKAEAVAVGLSRLEQLTRVDDLAMADLLLRIREEEPALLAGLSYDDTAINDLLEAVAAAHGGGQAEAQTGPEATAEAVAAFPELANEDDTTPPSDKGTLLQLLDVTVGEPRHEADPGSVWQLGDHVLVVADVMTGHDVWHKRLEPHHYFVPYPGPFVLLSQKASSVSMLLVQPDPYLAGHILDKWASIHGDPARVE